jgi:salicylate hydroxylase
MFATSPKIRAARNCSNLFFSQAPYGFKGILLCRNQRIFSSSVLQQIAEMPAFRVLIIGCGVAGPVLALLLKGKGYEPVVFEKVRELGDAGASLLMMPNGYVRWPLSRERFLTPSTRIKVLSLVGLSKIVTESAPPLVEIRDQSSTGDDIGMTDLPSRFQEKYGQPACGIKRTALNLALKDALTAANIEIHEGWKLNAIEEKGTSVVAISEEGKRVEGSMLVGCDGIKAMSRASLLRLNGVAAERASYTGLVQV